MPGPRLMTVNIDKGEPGTFKESVYLERERQRVLEGMLIAAWAVGIDRIYLTWATNIAAATRCSTPNWPGCTRSRRPLACPRGCCAVVSAFTSAATSR